jgi:hypothetical protein
VWSFAACVLTLVGALVVDQVAGALTRFPTTVDLIDVSTDSAPPFVAGQISARTKCLAGRKVTITDSGVFLGTVLTDATGAFRLEHEALALGSRVVGVVAKKRTRRYVCRSASVAQGAVYVAESGNDSASGTQLAPMRTITAAINNAQSLGTPSTVFVAEGAYEEAPQLVDGVDVLGGYRCAADDCPWTRDGDPSVISLTDVAGVRVPATVTRATALDGFTISAIADSSIGEPTIPGAGALSVSGRARISRNDIRGGRIFWQGGDTAGIAVDSAPAPGPLIVANVISGGFSDTGHAIGISVSTGFVEIDSNVVSGGRCGPFASGGCAGISADGVAGKITNNVVNGASAWETSGLVLREGSDPSVVLVVNGNTISGGGRTPLASGTTSAAITLRFAGGTDPEVFGRIRNNILLGGINETRWGLIEEAGTGDTVHPEAFENNDIFFEGSANGLEVEYALDNGDGTSTSYTSAAALDTAQAFAANNIDAEPLLDASHHIGATSPCRDAGTSTEAPGHDFEGDVRPAGAAVDIGADEVAAV